MLKKIFIGLLVMSVLSSGLLVFLLRQRGTEKHTTSHDTEEPTMTLADEHGHGAASSSDAHGAAADAHGGAEGEHAAAGAATDPHGTAAEVTKPGNEGHGGDAEEVATSAEAPAPEAVEGSGGHGDSHAAPKSAPKKQVTAATASTEQTLRLLTDPEGASVFVEGEFLGSTPVDLTLKNKPIKVAIEAKGYKRFERQIPAKNSQVGKGKNLFAAVMKIQLEPLKKVAKSELPPQEIPDEAPPESDVVAIHEENPFHAPEQSHKARPKAKHAAAATDDHDYYIQVKSLPDQGAPTQNEVARISTMVREKSAFAIFPCSVDLGTKGRWVRVLLGPYATKSAAREKLPEASDLAIDTESPFVTGEQKCL